MWGHHHGYRRKELRLCFVSSFLGCGSGNPYDCHDTTNDLSVKAMCSSQVHDSSGAGECARVTCYMTEVSKHGPPIPSYEYGDLPDRTWSPLLRVFQESDFLPHGPRPQHPIKPPSDISITAATCKLPRCAE